MPKRFRNFSLRFLFVVITALSIFMGYSSHRLRQLAKDQEILWALNVSIKSSSPIVQQFEKMNAGGLGTATRRQRAITIPCPLRPPAQNDRNEFRISLRPMAAVTVEPTPIWLSMYAKLSRSPYQFMVTELQIVSTGFSDDDLEEFAQISTLKSLDLFRSAVSDEGIRNLLQQSNLKRLNIGPANPAITDEAMSLASAITKRDNYKPHNMTPVQLKEFTFTPSNGKPPTTVMLPAN